ncbi:cell division protein FtsQ/DivIB [Succinivibrio dextrinosolvens]|jgi:cell division protein FtsQ|uniref:cell division protein FtsQ/DivIB n=1 Tax=Succinivibrio dextrinosolvens TaxID=83771 RepID=UPI0004E25F0D|nr:FtsQ-type POTRA domain-containing protein [Succinivibrio dextrinosolvens]MBE6421969.1 FtsQ-type POTRA domain-containing protein [Succinivibrio dextrinosolvens]MBQ3679220.1 FtsQ-type POTRA domain-containing protein [Succinivibrio sp.]
MSKKRHSRGYFIAGIIFVMLLLGLVVKGDLLIKHFLSQSNALPVKAVQIDGVFKNLTKKKIADITGRVCAGQNIATLDVKVLKQELLKEPWIAQVAIQKKMPDTLILSVIEHVPAAYWNDNGIYDAKTRSIFYPDMTNFALPLVKLGAYRDNLCTDVYDSAVSFIRVMTDSPYQMIELYLDNVRCYTITLDNGTKLILGRGQKDGIERLKRFIRSFKHSGLDINDVEYVDLRYDVGFAVGKKPASEDNKKN